MCYEEININLILKLNSWKDSPLLRVLFIYSETFYMYSDINK